MTRTELLLAMRRGESLVVTIAIPLGILVFFSTLDILADLPGRTVDFLVPGVLALAVVSSAMVALGISTGFERQQGVLKRLGSTPLGRGGLLSAKLATVVTVLGVQSAAIAATGVALGWEPQGSILAAAGLVVLGAAAFAAIGFTAAGRLRAETNLGMANGLFLLMLLLGGVVAPADRLPGPLPTLARLLPSEPLATGLRTVLDGGIVPTRILVTLAVWALVWGLIAVRTFRWEP